MADRSTLLKGFNNHFFDFLNDVASIISDNEEILTSKTFFETVKKANPTLIIKCWYAYVYTPYKDIIDSGNIEYFLEKDYVNDIAVLANSTEILKTINKIRAPIKDMSEVNQQHSMKYIQNLSKLSMMYEIGSK
jgi:predicted component of viral defense system (DUF524 family)